MIQAPKPFKDGQSGWRENSFMATKSLNSGRYHLINLIFFYFCLLSHFGTHHKHCTNEIDHINLGKFFISNYFSWKFNFLSRFAPCLFLVNRKTCLLVLLCLLIKNICLRFADVSTSDDEHRKINFYVIFFVTLIMQFFTWQFFGPNNRFRRRIWIYKFSQQFSLNSVERFFKLLSDDFYLKNIFPYFIPPRKFFFLLYPNRLFATADRELSTENENFPFRFRHQFMFSPHGESACCCGKWQKKNMFGNCFSWQQQMYGNWATRQK